MIKTFNPNDIDSEEECERIYNIVKDGKNKNLFKCAESWNVFFKEKDEENVIEKLNWKNKSFNNLSQYISYFDGGQHIRLGCEEITIAQCIDEVQENIEKYEDRIFTATNIEEEITQILKEQVGTVFEKKLAENREKIDSIINGDIDWR